MGIIALIFAFVFSAIGFLLILKNRRIEFCIFWFIVASATDSSGIVNFIDSNFGLYTAIMNLEVALCTLVSLEYYLKCRDRKYDSWIRLIIVISCLAVISFLIVGVEGFLIHRILDILCSSVPFGLIIFLCNEEKYVKDKKDFWSAFKFFVYFQIILCFLITYLPTIGFDALDFIKSSNYISDGYIYNKNLFHLKDLFQALTTKYVFNGLGHFHNANDMGFYGIVGIVVALETFRRDKNIFGRVFDAIVIVLSIILWGNSGMRGPVVGVAIGLIAYTAMTDKRTKILLIVLLLIGGGFLVYSEIGYNIAHYFITDTSNISFTSRYILRRNGLRYIDANPMFGSGGNISALVAQSIDPHELPLRMACLYGIPTAILFTILVYIKPGLLILKKKKEILTMIFFGIISMVTLTNNYTDFGLFQFMMAVIIIKASEEKGVDNSEKNRNFY